MFWASSYFLLACPVSDHSAGDPIRYDQTIRPLSCFVIPIFWYESKKLLEREVVEEEVESQIGTANKMIIWEMQREVVAAVDQPPNNKSSRTLDRQSFTGKKIVQE